MATSVIVHEVEDVDHWLASTRREEVFGPQGVSIRTFVDPQSAQRVGLIAEIPDLEAFEALLGSSAGANAMSFDGVRPETLVMLAER